MMELLQFVFSSIWTFFGSLIILSVILNGVRRIVLSFSQPKNNKNSSKIENENKEENFDELEYEIVEE